MADWTFAPDYDAEIQLEPPPTLVTILDDGKDLVREKHTTQDEIWTETYTFDGTEFDTAKAFWDSHRNSVSFTKLSYDVYGAPTTTRTVRFKGAWRLVRAGEDTFVVEITFRRVN